MDIFNKPQSADTDIIKNLGPLAALAGVREGDKGVDVSPSREGDVASKCRERLTLESSRPVMNGPQVCCA